MSTGRRLILIVALFATLQTLLHSHSLSDSSSHSSTAAQSCVLCVSTATTLPAAAVHLPPPAVTEGPAATPIDSTGSRFTALALSSRAPPQR